MEEKWKTINGFDTYQISNLGHVKSFRDVNNPKIMSTSDDGNGYQKVMLYANDGSRKCKKIHKLVAEAFIPKPESNEELTVDHIISGEEGKNNNCVDNLRWITRRENIQKAYRDGVCDERIRGQRKLISCYDDWVGDEEWFESIEEASNYLHIERTTISHALGDGTKVKGRYYFEIITGKERLLYDETSSKRFSGV